MKKTTTARTVRLAAAFTLALAAGTLASSAGAQTTSTILNTKHNLSAVVPGSTSANRFTATSTADDEVCVFCHTPHAASTTANAPLWNKATPTTIAYSLYSSTTMDASRATDGVSSGAIGSVSIACLSCHDGVNAMNSVINAPGSGAGTGAIPGTWTAGSGTMGTAITKLVEDNTIGLSNDHPIGIAYCGWSAVAAGTGALTCGDADFKTPAVGTAGGSTQVWWLDTEATPNTLRNKTDIILYNRAFGANTGPSVECASCHDPHLEKYADGSNARTFLRVANTGSKVCLACHAK